MNCKSCDSYNIFLNNYENANFDDSHKILLQQTQCIQSQLQCVTNNIYTTTHNEDNDKFITSTQLNTDSMNMYLTDYYYVMIKGILYFVILALFIYFYGISNLLENIKMTTSSVKDKAIQIKDTVKENTFVKNAMKIKE